MRLLAVAALLLTIAPAGAASGTGPYLLVSDHFYVRPSFTFEISSAARNMMIGHTHWLTWSRDGATARTTLFTNTCVPSCNEGRYREQPARVHLFELSRCRGKQVFAAFEVVDADGARLAAGTFRGLGYLRHC
jgi:hypothetical protein